MAKILFTWEFGEAAGHVGAFQPIARRLIDRGHQVVLAMRDLSLAPSLFPDPDVQVCQAPTRNARTNHSQRRPVTYADLLHNFGFYDSDQVSCLLKAWVPIFDGASPDLVVGDFAPISCLVSRSLQIPYALFGNGYFVPPATEPLQRLRGMESFTESNRSDEESTCKVLDEAFTNVGGPELRSISCICHDAAAILLNTFVEFDHYAPVKRPTYLGCWALGSGTRPQFPKSSLRSAFAYLKPFANIEQLFVKLQRWGISTVVSCDGLPEATARKFASPRLMFTNRKVDLTYAAENADFAITNGNHGTSVSMVLRGKPVLAFPLHQEQQITALNLERNSFGVQASPNEVSSFADALGQIAFDDELYIQANSFRDRYAAHSDEQRISDTVGILEDVIR